MTNERELVVEISRIGQQSESIKDAVNLTQALLGEEIGGSVLLVHSSEPGISLLATKPVSEFLDSHEFPFRGLYTAPLIVRGRNVGRLIACFGSFGSPGESLSRLTAHIAEQLGRLLARTQREGLPRSEAA